MKDFKAMLIFQAKEERVYAALTLSIHQWWTDMFDGNAQEPGETFSVGFGPQVHKTMLVEELIANEKVVWLVVNALIDLPELDKKNEWTGTRIVWKISGTDGGTVLELTHRGLTPEVECYQMCSNGWQSFLQSFEKFINTGVGTPFKIADALSIRKD